MNTYLDRALNLRDGELSRGLRLFLYLFLVMFSYVVGKSARDALFLDRFRAVQLPYADIAVAVLVGVVVAMYIRLGRLVSLRNLLACSLLGFGGLSAVFWWLSHYYPRPWLFPAIYIWVGVFGVLAPAQVWTLANYVLTTRQAKRLFGLIGSGAIGGWIVGGLLTRATATRFGTENTLLVVAAGLLASAGLVISIWRQRQTTQADEDDWASERRETSGGLRESLALVWSSPYLRAIAAVILLSSFVTTTAGWQFKAIAKEHIPGKDALAAFFGTFNFYAGLGSLVAQVLLTAAVLQRFGIGFALFIVPAALTFGSLGVLIWGTLAAAILLKGSDQVLRYSIDKSTVELLYLPVPASQTFQAKSFIDTVVWRVGDGLAGVTVLIFAGWLNLSPGRISVVTLLLIAGWVTAAYRARRQYVENLSDSIHQHRLDAERAAAPVIDRSTTQIFAAGLTSDDPQDLLYGLSLFELGHRRTMHPAVRGLLKHRAPEVRQKALALLSTAGDTTVLPQVERLLYDEHLAVRTEALLYLTHHAHIDPLERIEKLGDFPDFSIRSAMVAFLARPGPSENLDAAHLLLEKMVTESGPEGRRARIEAARLIATLPDQFERELRILLQDLDSEVARHAVKAVGVLRKRPFIPRVLERMENPEIAAEAIEALARFGDRIVGTLRDYLVDPDVPVEIRREIPLVLQQIGTQAAGLVLTESLLDRDTALRFRVIAALNKLRQLHPTRQIDTRMIETVLAAEIMGHYRSYQILGTLGGSLDSPDPVAQALRDSINQEVERIFRLLKILYPGHDLHSAYFGLQSTNPVVHDNALEFLENILNPQMRALLVPLLDSGVSVTERVRVANRLLGAKVESREEAVAALMVSEDPWLKSCAAYAIGTLGLKSLEPELDKWLDAPDPLLRETAREAKHRLAAIA